MSQADINEGRKHRGQVSKKFLNQYLSEPVNSLITMLADKTPQVRTAAATILGERKAKSAINALSEALIIEKALYSRLAICEALVSIGDPAIDPLIHLLGKIGSNQHRKLPEKGFYKRSYPLPRDMAARTLIRMGPKVLEKIEPVLQGNDRTQLLEAIDVVGHLSNQYANENCLPALLALYNASIGDELMQWKIVRAFQAFPNQQVTNLILQMIASSSIAQLRWEAIRSLGLQERVFDRQILQDLKNDSDNEVRHLIELFL